MLNPFDQKLDDIAIVYAHSGIREDKDNAIYSIAATIYSKGERKKEYKSDLKYSHFSARERFYSNLSKETLSSAPSIDKVRTEIQKFLKNQNVILFFDTYNKSERILELCGVNRFIDLRFVSEFFFPQIGACSTKTIWEFIHNKEREKVSFQANEVVDLSIELINHICSTILNDNKSPHASSIRYFLEKSNTLFGRTFIQIAEKYKEYFGGLFDVCNKSNSPNWKEHLPKATFPKKDNEEDDKALYQSISKEQIQNLYEGMSKSGNNFKFRNEQVAFANHIVDALNDSAVLTIEAGTGTGKTQGYLVPSMEFLYRNKDARIAISTYTKSLQEQIFQRELPFTKSIFKQYNDIPVALLKGKNSYICAEKLDTLWDEDLTGWHLLIWIYFLIVLFDFRNSDLDSIGDSIKYYLNQDHSLFKILYEISAKDGCGPKHLRCPAQVVIAEASKSRLIVTNHHKLSHIESEDALSGLFRNYIIDEANLFEDAVRNSFGKEIESKEIATIAEYLNKTLKKVLKKAASENLKIIQTTISKISDLNHSIGEMRAVLLQLNPQREMGQSYELQMDHPAFKKGQIDTLLVSFENSMSKINSLLDLFNDENKCRQLKIVSRTAQRIKRSAKQLKDFSEDFGTVLRNIKLQNQITAYQIFQKNWVISSQSVDVANIINTHFYKRKDCIVFTAATICHNDTFDCFKKITGQNLRGEKSTNKKPDELKEFRFSNIPSPFSKDQMEILVHERAVSGKYDNKQAWIESVSDILPELIRKNKGRTLVLFSSYTDLQQVANSIGGMIENEGYPLLIQKRGVSSKILCDEFRTIKESVLLGVDTFWYGVDFKGDTLTQVIITRIPFNLPSSPIQLVRKRTMPTKEFWERYWFDSDIKLKQGIGRLIRSDSDKGKVFFLDSRYKVQKKYNPPHTLNQSSYQPFNEDEYIQLNSHIEENHRDLMDQTFGSNSIKESLDPIIINLPSPTIENTSQQVKVHSDSISFTSIKNEIKKIPITKTNASFTDIRLKEIRKQYHRAYEPWTDKEDELLDKAYKKNNELYELANLFQRQPGAIQSRINKKIKNEKGTHLQEGQYISPTKEVSGYKDIVCFANSHKYGGSCIAGKELISTGKSMWFRPVSNKQTGEISIASLEDNADVFPKALDVISIPILKHFPHYYQTENFLINVNERWILKDKITLSDLPNYHDEAETLWVNGYNTFAGYNDKIPLDIAFTECTSSLLLIQPENLVINVAIEREKKKKVRAKFIYNGVHYSLVVTDKLFKAKYINQDEGEYDADMNNISLCISISEPLNAFCYKLVAGVIGESI